MKIKKTYIGETYIRKNSRVLLIVPEKSKKLLSAKFIEGAKKNGITLVFGTPLEDDTLTHFKCQSGPKFDYFFESLTTFGKKFCLVCIHEPSE